MQKFQKLAEQLPWSKHVHSKLICAITHDLMNEHNPPMVLPNGAVYSQKAVEITAATNHGIFTCPKTGGAVTHFTRGEERMHEEGVRYIACRCTTLPCMQSMVELMTDTSVWVWAGVSCDVNDLRRAYIS